MKQGLSLAVELEIIGARKSVQHMPKHVQAHIPWCFAFGSVVDDAVGAPEIAPGCHLNLQHSWVGVSFFPPGAYFGEVRGSVSNKPWVSS
jgi:hypothetical protein